MKVQCDVCERAEATLLCCADEAALCGACDQRVHAANKLAGKHQRIPLLAPDSADAGGGGCARMPTCDICQEKAGYFFCLEDRALLCRNCDLGIHTTSPHGSSHRRYLITGVRVALQHYLSDNCSNSTSSNTYSINNNICNSSSSNGNSDNLAIPPASDSSITDKKLWPTPTSLGMDHGEGMRAQWMWNDVFDSVEFAQCYGISEPGSSS